MEADIQQARINIDLDKLNELVQVGARRASSFMALGTAAADQIKLSTLKQPSLLSYQFLPEPLSDQLSAQIGEEFRIWIAGCALREIEQHFSFFLDRVGETLKIAELHGTRVHSSFDFRNKGFEVKNAADKFAAVASKLSISLSPEKHLRKLVASRNILTHRLGYVPTDYVDELDELTISWVGAEIFLEGNGQQIIVPVESPEPFHAPAFETGAFIRFVEKQKKFRVGQRLELTPFELAEICQFYISCSASIGGGLKTMAASQGSLIIKPAPNAGNEEIGYE